MSTIENTPVSARDVRRPLPPNHHRDAGPSCGIVGYLSGLTMAVGRRRFARLVTRIADVDKTDHVIDIGCGPGTAARVAASAGAGVTGVDPSAPMLRLARLLSRVGGKSGDVQWLRAGAEHVPMRISSGTVCWSLSSVHHWLDLDKAIFEVDRILRPGGRFVALEHRTKPGSTGWASHGWTPDQAEHFADLLSHAGFVDVHATDHDLGRRGLVAVIATKPTEKIPDRVGVHHES